MQESFTAILASIPRPSPSQSGGESKYNVQPISWATDHYFGRNNDGLPCLLLSSHETLAKAPVRLTGIEVQFALPCRIKMPDSLEMVETFTVVLCTSQELVIQDYFAHICEMIVQIVGPHPTIQHVINIVSRLIELFQRLSRPSLRPVSGLFGELFVAHVSASPADTVRAWRSTVDERFDFSANDIRLEVKSNSTRQRTHFFSLEQCNPPHGTIGILISLFVETIGGGLSLLELIERLERQLANDVDLILKLQETVADGLGASVNTALSMRFDEYLARTSLQVYELNSIPKIQGIIPNEVSQVRFRSDISRTPPVEINTFIARYPRARLLLPAKAFVANPSTR